MDLSNNSEPDNHPIRWKCCDFHMAQLTHRQKQKLRSKHFQHTVRGPRHIAERNENHARKVEAKHARELEECAKIAAILGCSPDDVNQMKPSAARFTPYPTDKVKFRSQTATATPAANSNVADTTTNAEPTTGGSDDGSALNNEDVAISAAIQEPFYADAHLAKSLFAGENNVSEAYNDEVALD